MIITVPIPNPYAKNWITVSIELGEVKLIPVTAINIGRVQLRDAVAYAIPYRIYPFALTEFGVPPMWEAARWANPLYSFPPLSIHAPVSERNNPTLRPIHGMARMRNWAPEPMSKPAVPNMIRNPVVTANPTINAFAVRFNLVD